MTERMKTFIYCAITAIVTTIVVTAGQPQAAQAQLTPPKQTITHIIKFGSEEPRDHGYDGRHNQLRTLMKAQKRVYLLN